ncbi:MAG: hypothetical protein J5590_05190 [Clostridia bacterium]|nr:hypothetical protein [Clostridia bacterium]
MIKADNIKLPPGYSEADVKHAAAKKLNTSAGNIKEIKIIRKSIDARKNPQYVLSLAVDLKNYDGIKGEEYEETKPIYIIKKKFKKRPVVVGFGPAGMFAAYVLAKSGAEPVIIERGTEAAKRKADIDMFTKGAAFSENSNIQFGEGGAGMFSDGKLATGIKSPYIKNIFETFVKCGAQEEILYSAKPHIGSDVLPKVVTNLRREIENLGGVFRFETPLTGIKLNDGRVCAAVCGEEEIETDNILLSVGHSARDTFRMLYDLGAELEAKPFAIGCRIEHLQKDINRAQYGNAADMFPPADYKLSCHLKSGYSVYTFCMCPGGYVVNSASENGTIVTNGYSESGRDGENANSALLVGISPQMLGGDLWAGINLQKDIEKRAFDISGSNKAPCQTVGDFLKGRASQTFGKIRPTFSTGVIPSDISLCLPRFVTDALREGIIEFAKKIRGFDSSDALLTAPETRSSSPVRMVRGEDMQSNIKGLFPAGEGSGYAGGITSSAVDGIRSALKMIELVL